MSPLKHLPIRVVIPGGNGQVGTVLARHFHAQGNSVVVFARRPITAPWRSVTWDGLRLGEWVKELNDVDVLINLTGRNVNCRYNTKNCQEIMESRVHSTRLLGEALNEIVHPPRTAIMDERQHRNHLPPCLRSPHGRIHWRNRRP